MGFTIPDRAPVTIDEGVWASYEGSEFKIAYSTNVRFLRLKQRLEHPHRRKIENGSIDPAEHRKILCKAMAEAILLDWRKVKDGDGNEVQYSIKAAEQALLYDEAFREFVMTFSMELGNFREEEMEMEGNG